MNKAAPAQSKYRPDVDGLRALAVLSVFLFHLQPALLPGGFLGVDVFFVISGYLITGILLREGYLGTFSFSHFYARRVKRIFPALFVVLMLSSIVAVFLLTPETYVNYMKSARYASAQLSNFFFAQNVGYFEEGFSGQPLLHTWSLGVEEQFYLVWPILIYFCFRFVRIRLAAGEVSESADIFAADDTSHSKIQALNIVIGAVLTLLFFASYILCYVITETDVNLAFYMFFTRAFEFCIGGALALEKIRRSFSKRLQQLAGLTGLILIVGSFLVVQQEFVGGSFLRYGTIITCFGAAMIIYANDRTSIVNKLLAGWLPVSVGKISYSLYLYHWPVIIFWKQYSDEDKLDLTTSLVIIAISFVFSALSYRYVEQPARKSAWPDRRVLLTALSVIVVFAGSFRFLEDQHVASWRITPYSSTPDAAQGYSPDCSRRFENGVMVFDCFADKSASRPAIALVGDSHSAHYFCAVSEWAKKNGYVFKYLGIAGCPMLVGDVSIKSMISEEHAEQCKTALSAFDKGIIQDPGVQLVLIAQRYDLFYDGRGYLSTSRQMLFKDGNDQTIEDHTDYYRSQLRATVDMLRSYGKDVLLLGQVPLFRSVDACDWQPRIKKLLSKERVCSYDFNFIEAWQRPSISFIEEFTSANRVTYFDPFPYLDQPLKNGINLYENIDHINDQGCLYLAPYIFNALDQLTATRERNARKGDVHP